MQIFNESQRAELSALAEGKSYEVAARTSGGGSGVMSWRWRPVGAFPASSPKEAAKAYLKTVKEKKPTHLQVSDRVGYGPSKGVWTIDLKDWSLMDLGQYMNKRDARLYKTTW